MSIQFNPQSLPCAATSDASGQRATPLATLTMAPVDLTPLAPPSSAPMLPVQPAYGQDPVAKERKSAFAERQKALLERLRQGAAVPTAAQAGGLSEAQRSACLLVLTAVAAATAR